MKQSQKLQTSVSYAPEFRALAVDLMFMHCHEYQSGAVALPWIANKLGCSSESLGVWSWQAQHNVAELFVNERAECARIKELEREIRDLRQANEFLKRLCTNFSEI